MTGKQATLVLALRKMTRDVETGKYGEGDDIDYDAFCDDIVEDVLGIVE